VCSRTSARQKWDEFEPMRNEHQCLSQVNGPDPHSKAAYCLSLIPVLCVPPRKWNLTCFHDVISLWIIIYYCFGCGLVISHGKVSAYGTYTSVAA
jgi:hypothetical protein